MSSPKWMPETGDHERLTKLHEGLEAAGFKRTFGSGNAAGDITYRYEAVNPKIHGRMWLLARRSGAHVIVDSHEEAYGRGCAERSSQV